MCIYAGSQAKIEKRSKRNLYEGSRLLDQHRKQVRPNSMFLRSAADMRVHSKRTKRCS